MKLLYLFVALIGLVQPAAAQNGPALDPSFPLASIYQPADARGALQLSSGARVVVGYFDKAAGQLYSSSHTSLVRYQPSGRPDAVFNAAVAADDYQVTTMAEAANGKLLLGISGASIVGGQLAPALVQLNADGTRDAAFAIPTPVSYIDRILVQPDGKIVVGGNLTFVNQTLVPGLARLNANGTPDTTFQPQLSNGRITGVGGLALQPDGKLLVSAYVEVPGTTGGQFQLVRLQANGTQDLTFQPTLNSGVVLSDVAVQPDGQVVVAAAGGPPIVPGGTSLLARFSTTGVADASFAPDAALVIFRSTMLPMLVVQPDGRMLVGHYPARVAAGHSPVARLLPSGAFDPAWNTPQLPDDDLLPNANSLQLLPTGQVLVAGTLARLGVADGLEGGAVLLDATGLPSAGFRPVLQRNGQVADVAQQPDGRLVAVGTFSEVNDVAVRGIVRFQLDGTIDANFSSRASITGGWPARLLAQPNGTLLVGGSFAGVGGVAQPSVARLLSSGQPDASFASPLTSKASVIEMVRQPDGRLLLAGTLRQPGVFMAKSFFRLETDGTIDTSFLPPTDVVPYALLVQPDGNIVVGSSTPARQLLRLLPSGGLDPAFTIPVVVASGSNIPVVSSLAIQPDGRLIVAGIFSQIGSWASAHVARLLPSGLPDVTFATQLLQASGRATAVAVQPNGRVLLAGTPTLLSPVAAPSLYRLLSDGSTDVSFDPSYGPNRGRQLVGTSRILVQADGAIVAAGGFTSVRGLPVLGLARFLDSHVLAVHHAAVAIGLQAWPVPAHGTLHVQFDAVARPRYLRLLNAVGQAVRTQAAPLVESSINITGLAPGLYLLQAEYVDAATVTQRVMVE